ncbi:MAG: hypothetical protein L6Q26_04530 [Anaerolineales bacterium]|nr:hypothetical protein [Anaerolineales bacterium]NUQ85167.1 hypothetical protein [Anaerolineales bacterium]
MRKWIADNEVIVMLVALAAISALVYLPLVNRLGYYYDDWYLMYSARAYGSEAFIDIFSVDRPARALVMIPAYTLFGENPLYYNLSAYAFRLISAMAFLWTLRMLFPRQQNAAFLASVIFLIYPGFLSQTNGIDYQSHLLGLAAAHLSIALTVKAVLTDRLAARALLYALSVLSGLLYLSQMEWYIGFEIFRWAGVFLLSSCMGGTLLQKAGRTIRSAFPTLAVPGIFLVWRLFFFQSERGATDVNLQLEQVRLYPVQIIYRWAVQVLQDLFDVFLSAWAIPLSQLKGYIQVWGGALAFLLAGLLVFFLYLYKDQEERNAPSQGFMREAMIFGLFVAAGGLLPIAMVNREVSFPAFSRYSLVSSAGVAVFVSAFLMGIKQGLFRNGLAALLVVVSVLTHHANAVKAAQQTAATNNFWWQVSWRVPQFEKNATLIAGYPGVPLEEDYFVWGPANLIYYPDERQNERNIQPALFAAILNRDTVEKVLARERQEYRKRKTIITYTNYRNILVLTQPGVNSCVHVIDGNAPEFSYGEWDFILQVGPYSELEHALADETPHAPPTVVFGPEPVRGWCYYYQKAALARQRGEWEEVQRIGEQAFGRGFEPQDLIEWMPFLQAYAIGGDVDRLIELAPRIGSQPHIAEQACRILVSTEGIAEPVLEEATSLYCAGQ